jgi:hypothetical protein
MKPLIATLLISLSGLCSESNVMTIGSATSSASSIQAGHRPPATAEWCLCALSIEEKVFLQQYDIEPSMK